jgi:dolichyl-phosphate beta-glucosyltransferase
MDPERIADFINIGIIILLIITFIYVLCDRFISDVTLFDLMNLRPSDPRRLMYFVEPSPSVSDPLPFPSVFDPSDVYLSLIIPISNEESRVSNALSDVVRYFTVRQHNDSSFSWEIIVVDDGSRDRTADSVIEFARQERGLRLLRQPRVMGKGAAVQAGCLHARGKLILMLSQN